MQAITSNRARLGLMEPYHAQDGPDRGESSSRFCRQIEWNLSAFCWKLTNYRYWILRFKSSALHGLPSNCPKWGFIPILGITWGWTSDDVPHWIEVGPALPHCTSISCDNLHLVIGDPFYNGGSISQAHHLSAKKHDRFGSQYKFTDLLQKCLVRVHHLSLQHALAMPVAQLSLPFQTTFELLNENMWATQNLLLNDFVHELL